MLFTDNATQLGPQLAVETSKTAVLDAEQVTSIANAVGTSRQTSERRCPRAESGYCLRNSPITTANDGLAMML
jgi:hypothetical protein